MKKVLLLTTGGTISSRASENGLAPGKVDLLALTGLRDPDLQVDIKELMSLDSSNIKPHEWEVIARAVFEASGSYDGIVVSHGTDTMGYTASMMSFMLQNPRIPIVFTGSQLPIEHPLTDAVGNLRAAFAMARSETPGVFVAFGRKIILGCRAVKARTVGFDAFLSVNRPAVATLSARGLMIDPAILPERKGDFTFYGSADPRVFLIKLTPASDPGIIKMVMDAGYRGIVVEAFGAGGLQDDFSSAIKETTARGVPIVVVSQCLYEQADLSIYQVGRAALQAGAIPGYDMTTEAAVTKLMWALKNCGGMAGVREAFARDIAGEVKFG